ncbi:MAG: GNAT family protein [Sphingomonas paucimobilis]
MGEYGTLAGVIRLSTITSGYFEGNPASGRVLAKLGFVETGRRMGDCLATGDAVPTVRMALAPTQFRPIRPLCNAA